MMRPMLRFVRAAIVIAAIAALSVVVLTTMLAESRDPGVGQPFDSQVPDPTQTVPPAARMYDSQSIIGPDYDAQAVHGPTRSKSQSKLWFNDGAWWAVMVDSADGEFRISHFDPAEKAWLDALFLMRYDNPAHREMMDLEGLRAWLPGRTTRTTPCRRWSAPSGPPRSSRTGR